MMISPFIASGEPLGFWPGVFLFGLFCVALPLAVLALGLGCTRSKGWRAVGRRVALGVLGISGLQVLALISLIAVWREFVGQQVLLLGPAVIAYGALAAVRRAERAIPTERVDS